MSLERIRQRYAGKEEEEWNRLTSTPITRTEYLITSNCLQWYLPSTGSILDAGSGPGRYAIDLASRGYRVVMLDLLLEMLRLGKAKLAEAAVERGTVALVSGDVAAVPFADQVFDAVICLGGTLSHLTQEQARIEAVAEMARVANPGGWVFLTGILRTPGRGAIYWGQWDSFDKSVTPKFRETGIIEGSHVWYTFRIGELGELAESAGLHIVDRVGCEGLAAHLPMEHLREVENNPKRWAAWREVLLETCNDPTIIGVSSHLLLVTRKQR